MKSFTSTFSRRKLLLLGGAALGTASLAGYALLPNKAMASNHSAYMKPLAIPRLETGQMNGDVRTFGLSVQTGMREFFDDLKTDTMGINGDYLGPVLRMRKGERVRLHVKNTLSIGTTLHWHGFNLPASTDGGPHQLIEPAATWSPEFEVKEAASTMWYHSHVMHETASQVWAGLAGVIIIDDDVADGLDLPSQYGVDDIPVILQDRRFYRDGSMPYERSMHDRMAGMTGNIPVINGTVLPYLETTTARVRLRLLNGANASIYNLTFSDQRSFHQIASDGGLLAEPVELTQLTLSPGERAEVIVDVSNGQKTMLKSVAAELQAGMGRMMGEQSPIFDLLEIRPKAPVNAVTPLPEKLAELPAIDPGQVTKHRKFLLEMGGMMGGRGFTINGQEMDMNRIDEVVKKGEVEIWTIQNAGPMRHPFHIHNTQFRILSRDGRAPSPNEAGRKDTVLVDPGESVDILVRFDHYTDAKRPYMYHCHILEHEDAGMMGQFTVV